MKILVGIANYGTKNRRFLDKIINEFNSMNYDIDIVIFSEIEKKFSEDIEQVVGLPTKDPWSLPFGHRKTFVERVDDYDLFIYMEDDTFITQSNIDSFIKINEIVPENYIPGFIRYELDEHNNKYYSTIHSHFFWKPQSIKKFGDHLFAEFSNEHSAAYILTKEHLKKVIATGQYNILPHDDEYDMLCSAATDPYAKCGLTKIVCISDLEPFLFHHMPNIYIGKLGITHEELYSQINFMIANYETGISSEKLFNTETNFSDPTWHKNYYEKSSQEIKNLVTEKSARILSIGCGSGNLESELVDKGNEVTAIPIDSIIGSCAESKGITVLKPDFSSSFKALQNKQFDYIILSNVVQFLDEPIEILSKLSSLLPENGEMIIKVPNFKDITLKKTLFKINLDIKMNFEQAGIHFTNFKIVQKWLSESGLKISSIHCGFADRSKSIVKFLPHFLHLFFARDLIITARKS